MPGDHRLEGVGLIWPVIKRTATRDVEHHPYFFSYHCRSHPCIATRLVHEVYVMLMDELHGRSSPAFDGHQVIFKDELPAIALSVHSKLANLIIS